MSSAISRKIEEIELSGLREAKELLVENPATANMILSLLPDCAGRLTRVPVVFPVHEYENPLDAGMVKSRYQVGPVDPMILFIGNLNQQYGPDLLVKSLPPVLKNHGQARLVVVGDGDLYWPLKVFTRYLLLEHAVRLVGHMEGQPVRELIQAADVVVVPSRSETPWWPIQAAWAARRPVVASHQAAPTLLEHERDSILFYPSENSCVWGVERVLYDPDLGKTLADNGHAKLDERFGWSAMAALVAERMSKAKSR
jgi:glycosyltransferase involved in cell wall biosynthesis